MTRNFINILAAKSSDDVALRSDSEEISYGVLLSRVYAHAIDLGLNRISASQRIIIGLEDSQKILLTLLACWKCNLIPVIAREGRKVAHLAELAKFSNAAAIVYSDMSCEILPSDRDMIPHEEECLIICTSGTTGNPKMVALPWSSILLNAKAISSQLDLTSADIVAVTTSLTYSYGLLGTAIAGLYAGACLRFFPKNAPPPQVLQTIRREALTVVQGPPSLWHLFEAFWDKTVFTSVRCVTVGGESLSSDLQVFFNTAFPAADKQSIFGMTEAGPRISHLNFEAGGGLDSRIGVPFKHFDWRIDPVDDPEMSEESGRLVLRGPAMFIGYLQADGTYSGKDAEGYFHSSDLVKFTPEIGLQFLGRLDAVFKSGGKLVNPLEVEEALLSHQAVKEVLCTPEPHKILGLVPVATVVPKHGMTLDLKDIVAHCSAVLQPHAVPKKITLAQTLPVAASGKRLRTPVQ